MDKLPRVFANPISKKINNVQETYYGNDTRNIDVNPTNINSKINEIFSSKDHIYKSKVKITFRDKVSEEVIVGKTNVNLLTIDGKLIRITEIVDIEKI